MRPALNLNCFDTILKFLALHQNYEFVVRVWKIVLYFNNNNNLIVTTAHSSFFGYVILKRSCLILDECKKVFANFIYSFLGKKECCPVIFYSANYSSLPCVTPIRTGGLHN